MRVKVYPYKAGSRSARALARELGVKRLKLKGSRYRPRTNDLIINWGNPRYPDGWRDVYKFSCWNHPDAVAMASSKIKSVGEMKEHDVPVVPLTQDIEEARRWQAEGHLVVARSLDRGHSGRGITIVQPDQPIPNTLFYTRYIKKIREYRVHILPTGVPFVQQKKMRNKEDRPDNFNMQVRNHANGWVFTHHDIDKPKEAAIGISKAAVKSLGLTFGAVDLIYNELNDQYTVLEVNTAPGLEGTTLEVYGQAFRTAIQAGEVL